MVLPIQSINNPNTIPVNLAIVPIVADAQDGSAFRVYEVQKEAPNKVKAGVMFTTLAGITAVMIGAVKYKKMPCGNPLQFLKSLTKINYDSEKMEVEKLVTALAIGSVGGGLLGGRIFDKKENFRAKYREAVSQMVGNIFTPLIFVAGGARTFEAIAKKFPKTFHTGTKSCKFVEVITTGLCLFAGIVTGNKLGNHINEKSFHIKDKRKIKLTDMSPHIDDLCLATSLIAQNIKIVPRFIPLALVVAGFSTGVTQEKPELLRLENAKNYHREKQKEKIQKEYLQKEQAEKLKTLN